MLFRILLTTLALIFASCSYAFAQTVIKERIVSIDSATGNTTVTTRTITREEVTPYTNSINTGPSNFISVINLNWIHKFSDHIAGGFGFKFGTNQDAEAITAEIRFYTSQMALNGFYLAPDIAYIFGRGYDIDTSTYTYQQVQIFTIGFLAGWQWFPASNFSLGIAVGLDAYFPIGNVPGPNYFALGTSYGSGAITPVARCDIGYAW